MTGNLVCMVAASKTDARVSFEGSSNPVPCWESSTADALKMKPRVVAPLPCSCTWPFVYAM